MANQSPPNSKKKPGDRADDIFEAPQITREPVSRQVVLGGKITLRIMATGVPLPSYQWYLNGKKISGANSDRLVINKSRRDHVGAYTCEAKNFVGKAVSRAAMISFLIEKIPAFVIEPALASVPTGQPFKFRIASPGKDVLKRFKLQWLFNGKRITGATGAELQFTQVKKKYEGEYKVIVLVAGDIVASNSVKLMALAAEEASQIMPALTKEKTAFIAAPPKEAFFFDPLEDEEEENPVPPMPEEPDVVEAAQEVAECLPTEEPLPALPEPESISAESPATIAAAAKPLGLIKKRKALEKILERWGEQVTAAKDKGKQAA